VEKQISVRAPWLALALIAVATGILHLALGLYYATRVLTVEQKPSLSVTGEAYLRSFAGWDTEQEVDSPGYNRAAVAAMETGIPRSKTGSVFFRAAGYAYFLAACYSVGGLRLISVAVPQAVFNGLTCLLIGLAAGRIASRHKNAAMIIGALLVLVNLRLAMYVGYVYPTCLVMTLLALALWAATGPLTSGRALGVAGALIFGTFSQGAFFVVTFAAGCWFALEWWRRRQGAAALGFAVVALAIAAKFILTWSAARGGDLDYWQRMDRGGTLWLTNNPYYESMTWQSAWECRPGNPWTSWQKTDAEESRYADYLSQADGDYGKAATLWIRENPAQYVKLCFIRLRTELGPTTGQMSPRNRKISTALWLLVFPAGFAGLWLARREFGWGLGALIVLGVIAFDTLFIVEWYFRYRFPVDMTLTMFAAVALARLVRRRQEAA